MRLKMGSRRAEEAGGGGGLAEERLSESRSDDSESTGEGELSNSAKSFIRCWW